MGLKMDWTGIEPKTSQRINTSNARRVNSLVEFKKYKKKIKRLKLELIMCKEQRVFSNPIEAKSESIQARISKNYLVNFSSFKLYIKNVYI